MYEPTNGRVSFAGKTIVESHPRGKMSKLYAGENKGVYKRRMVKTPDRITSAGHRAYLPEHPFVQVHDGV